MSAEAIRAAYRRAIDAVGETVTIRRYTGAGANRPYFDVAVRARVVGYAPQEMVGTIQEGDRKVILLAEDLIAAQAPLDLRKGDKIFVRGKEMDIHMADDSTRRVEGEIVAFEIRARG